MPSAWCIYTRRERTLAASPSAEQIGMCVRTGITCDCLLPQRDAIHCRVAPTSCAANTSALSLPRALNLFLDGSHCVGGLIYIYQPSQRHRLPDWMRYLQYFEKSALPTSSGLSPLTPSTG